MLKVREYPPISSEIKQGVTMKQLFLAGSLMALAACGGGGGSQKVVTGYSFDYRDGDAILDVEFSQDFSLNLEITKAIKNYGAISFIPADGAKGFSIRTTLATDAWLDSILTIEKTNRLPNGAPFPSYLGSELSKFEFVKTDKFKGLLYLGTQPQLKYLGAAIALDFVSEKFPAGIAISQGLFNKKNERIGVATVYGPLFDKDGKLLQPGGLFAAANLSVLTPKVGVAGFSEQAREVVHTNGDLEIYKPNNVKFTEEQAVDFLLKFKKEGKKAGVLN